MCRCHHSKPKPVGGFQCVSTVSAPAGLFAALPVNETDALCPSASVLHILVGGLSVSHDDCDC